jgi:hypothetical protein
MIHRSQRLFAFGFELLKSTGDIRKDGQPHNTRVASTILEQESAAEGHPEMLRKLSISRRMLSDARRVRMTSYQAPPETSDSNGKHANGSVRM